jgi:hypothetical protein
MAAESVPMWKRPGWLPEMEIVEWELLTCLREEHQRLLRALGRPEAPGLRHQFEKEDEDAIEAERSAIDSGSAVRSVELTPELRRQALLEAAEERDGSGLQNLCSHIRTTVQEIFGDKAEMDAAIDRAREAAGLAPVVEEKPTAVGTTTSEEINARKAEEVASLQAAAFKYSQQRQALGRDTDKLSALKRVTLSAQGVNVLGEIEEACPGVTDKGETLGILTGISSGAVR